MGDLSIPAGGARLTPDARRATSRVRRSRIPRWPRRADAASSSSDLRSRAADRRALPDDRRPRRAPSPAARRARRTGPPPARRRGRRRRGEPLHRRPRSGRRRPSRFRWPRHRSSLRGRSPGRGSSPSTTRITSGSGATAPPRRPTSKGRGNLQISPQGASGAATGSRRRGDRPQRTATAFVADRHEEQIFVLTPDGKRFAFASFTDGDAPRSLGFAPVTPETNAGPYRRRSLHRDDQGGPGRERGRTHLRPVRGIRRSTLSARQAARHRANCRNASGIRPRPVRGSYS